MITKINHLTPIEFCRRNKYGYQIWLFECDCKNKTRKEILLSSVKSGHTKSCGCLCNKDKIVHGLAEKHRLYKIWKNIKTRCYNKNCVQYKDYGKRDITICEEWKRDFKVFYDWALENGYQDDLTIDRIDNNKGYFPKNCRWITIQEQQKHKRNSKYFTFNGKTQNISEWEKELGFKKDILKSRIRRGWSIEKTLTTPVK